MKIKRTKNSLKLPLQPQNKVMRSKLSNKLIQMQILTSLQAPLRMPILIKTKTVHQQKMLQLKMGSQLLQAAKMSQKNRLLKKAKRNLSKQQHQLHYQLTERPKPVMIMTLMLTRTCSKQTQTKKVQLRTRSSTMTNRALGKPLW